MVDARAALARALGALFALAAAGYYAELPGEGDGALTALTAGRTRAGAGGDARTHAAHARPTALPSALLHRTGVEPAHALLEQRRVPGDVLDSLAGAPTALWLLDAVGVSSDAALDLIALSGVASGSVLAVTGGGRARAPLLALATFLHLSLINAGRPWLESALANADGALVEVGWAAALWAAGGTAGAPAPRAPLLLLRWAAAKAAVAAGLASLPTARRAWLATGSRAAAAAVACRLAVAPLALAPARAARTAAAVAVAAAPFLAPVGPTGWPQLLGLALAPALLATGAAAGAGGATARRVALFSSLATAAPAADLAIKLMRCKVDPTTSLCIPALSDAAVRAGAAAAAPAVVAVVAAAIAVSLALDLYDSLLATHGDPFVAPAPRGRGRPASARAPPGAKHGPPLAALAGVAAALIFGAGAFDVLTRPGGGAAGGCAACGGPAAFVAARRLSHTLRPWRVAGAVGGEAPADPDAAASAGLALEAASACPNGAWTRLAPQPAPLWPHAPRLAPALAAAADVDAAPWAEHAAALLAAGGSPALAAAVGWAPPSPPCAARVVDATTGAVLATHAADDEADGEAAEALARHGWGPLVQYSAAGAPTPFARALAAPRALGAPGAAAVGGMIFCAALARAAAAGVGGGARLGARRPARGKKD
jgi:hypothetical protein